MSIIQTGFANGRVWLCNCVCCFMHHPQAQRSYSQTTQTPIVECTTMYAEEASKVSQTRNKRRKDPKGLVITTWSQRSTMFMRDFKWQLLLVVRCVNIQQTTLPYSVSSPDSMHVRNFAAANRNVLTIFYSPSYMGTPTGTSNLDSLKRPDSKWCSLEVECDESVCGDNQNIESRFGSFFLGAQAEWENSMIPGICRPVYVNKMGELYCRDARY
ncbi:hypothetical protein ABFS83_14G296100 [Erythranthe nasuta]